MKAMPWVYLFIVGKVGCLPYQVNRSCFRLQSQKVTDTKWLRRYSFMHDITSSSFEAVWIYSSHTCTQHTINVMNKALALFRVYCIDWLYYYTKNVCVRMFVSVHISIYIGIRSMPCIIWWLYCIQYKYIERIQCVNVITSTGINGSDCTQTDSSSAYTEQAHTAYVPVYVGMCVTFHIFP